MNCDQTNKIARYHDGELSPADRATFDSHLADCESCRRDLAELRSLSMLVRSAERAPAPDDARPRWRRLRRAEERAVRRTAGWLTATAAAIILGVLLTWPAGQNPAASGTWMTLAMTSADVHDVSNDDSNPDTALTEWMANDLGDTETYSQ
jgi:anti-sigma factor RsiW